MRASFLISRRQPWMGQLLLMARNKALTLLLKLYRRTPIFRPRHLPGRNRTQNAEGSVNVCLPGRLSAKNSVFGGLVRLDLLEENTLEPDSDVELVADEDVFLDLQGLRRQGNFEMAVMAGGQLEVDSEEDGECDDYDCDGYVRFVAYEECEGEDDRLRDRIAGGLGQVKAAGAGAAVATSKGLQPGSGSRRAPPSKQVRA
ncbi:uncharacterized protein LOC108030797 [Drosophila biarmipes]|uniref:uncharacterized protein LOC108030797 n=1 Tax=Drosophila biarmipes TaxID=125945 RepID=UPI0007E850F9|nr:uncharacterized protein LOC108030797 [Drosophila biarmipes]